MNNKVQGGERRPFVSDIHVVRCRVFRRFAGTGTRSRCTGAANGSTASKFATCPFSWCGSHTWATATAAGEICNFWKWCSFTDSTNTNKKNHRGTKTHIWKCNHWNVCCPYMIHSQVQTGTRFCYNSQSIYGGQKITMVSPRPPSGGDATREFPWKLLLWVSSIVPAKSLERDV